MASLSRQADKAFYSPLLWGCLRGLEGESPSKYFKDVKIIIFTEKENSVPKITILAKEEEIAMKVGEQVVKKDDPVKSAGILVKREASISISRQILVNKVISLAKKQNVVTKPCEKCLGFVKPKANFAKIEMVTGTLCDKISRNQQRFS